MLSYAGLPRQSNFDAAAYRNLPPCVSTREAGVFNLPSGRVALLYFGSHQLGLRRYRAGVLPPPAGPATAVILFTPRPWPRASCAHTAPSVEVRDFEQEKSLDEHRRGPSGCSRAGRLWHYYLFCGPAAASQRAGQSRSNRDSKSQRLRRWRLADCGCLLRHPFQIQQHQSEFGF